MKPHRVRGSRTCPFVISCVTPPVLSYFIGSRVPTLVAISCFCLVTLVWIHKPALLVYRTLIYCPIIHLSIWKKNVPTRVSFSWLIFCYCSVKLRKILGKRDTSSRLTFYFWLLCNLGRMIAAVLVGYGCWLWLRLFQWYSNTVKIPR